MHRARSPKANQREISRIVSPLQRDHADGAFHGGVRNAHNALCHRRHRHVHVGGERRHSVRYRFCRQFSLATEEVLGRQPPEKKVRIGDSQVGSPLRVADRARIRSRTLRAHTQRASRIPICNRTTTSPHRVNVDDGNSYWRIANHGLARAAQVSSTQADVGARSSHVERDHVLVAGAAAHLEATHRPTRRSRKNRLHGQAPRSFQGEDAAVRLHNPDALRLQLHSQPR